MQLSLLTEHSMAPKCNVNFNIVTDQETEMSHLTLLSEFYICFFPYQCITMVCYALIWNPFQKMKIKSLCNLFYLLVQKHL